MEEVVMYKCGVCGKVYDTEEKCEACEAECRKKEPVVVYTMDYHPLNFNETFEISMKIHPASEGLKPTEDRAAVVDPEWGMDGEGMGSLRARWVLIVYESDKDIYQDMDYLDDQFQAWLDSQHDRFYEATRELYEKEV